MESAGSSPFSGGSVHRDVLDAPIPLDAMGRSILVNELKSRGKGAVQAQQWPDASLLYQKAIRVLEKQQEGNDDDDNGDKETNKEMAILQSNLSLCQGKMNQWDAALQHAERSSQLDSGYVKGWFRLGQAYGALGRWTDACQAFQKGLFVEPGNKALAKELERAEQKNRLVQQSQPDKATSPAATAASVTPPPPKAKPSSASATSSSKQQPKTSTATTVVDAAGEEFTQSDIVRGYKIVNGKKTSYFHNELTEETKKLIGDIAPKRLDSGGGAVPMEVDDGSTQQQQSKAASAWNKAGTWEERDITDWALRSLKEQLVGADRGNNKFEFGGDKVAVATEAAVDGSASVAMVRGKKKFIYELSAKVEFQVREQDTDETLAEGSFKFPDIDGTCAQGEPYEATDFTVKDSTGSRLSRNQIRPFVYDGGLRDQLHNAIDRWVDLLKETY